VGTHASACFPLEFEPPAFDLDEPGDGAGGFG